MPSSSPGRVVWALFSADWTAATQAEVPCSTQVVMMLVKPTSLPPMVMLTRVVVGDSAESWVLFTVAVVAPEQATERVRRRACAAAHSAG